MIRNLKALGLAVVAVLAMSAVVASAAQAEAGTVTAEKYPVTLTGSQVGTNELVVGNGARRVSCATANAHGTLAAASTSLTLTPSYSTCTSTGGLPVTVTVNGCDYNLAPTKVTATTGNVICPAGKQLVVDVYATAAKHTENVRACEYQIGEQKGLSAGEYHLEGAGTTREITATLNVTNIVTKNTIGSKLLCGLAAGETGTSVLTGTQTLTGEEDPPGAEPKHIGIFIS
jgi:hypothetical protein